MSKRPFNKIRKIEKIDNIENQQKEDFQEENINAEQVSKIPIFNIQKNKNPHSIYEALKKSQDETVAVDNKQSETRASTNLRPQLFKNKKEGKISKNDGLQVGEENYGEGSKPTPLNINKKRKFDFKNREKENIVIEQEGDAGLDHNAEQDVDQENHEQSLSKPDLRPRQRKDQEKHSYRPTREINQDSNKSNQMEDQKMPSMFTAQGINLEEQKPNISEQRMYKQQSRAYQLTKLLNLEIDTYESTLSVGCITPYEIYINKIKGGSLKNSNDQSFDDKLSSSSQTLPYDFADAFNQCPQDYLESDLRLRSNPQTSYEEFLLKIAPVIEELMQPSSSIASPPIFLLAFKPVFKAFFKCPYPLFVFHSSEFQLDLCIVGDRLFITQFDITSVLSIGKYLIAGLANGNLAVWSGQNNKSSRLYRKIQSIIQSTNFELPCFYTFELEDTADFTKQSIAQLLSQEKEEFSCLSSDGWISRWKIIHPNDKGCSLQAVSSLDVKLLLQNTSLHAYSFKKRNDNYFVSYSAGMICLNNNELTQKYDSGGNKLINFECPKRSNLIMSILENNQFRIYNEMYGGCLLKINVDLVSTASLQEIILPDMEHDNRQISILFLIYLIDSLGQIYELNILDDQTQPTLCPQPAPADERQIIFRGVKKHQNQIEIIRVLKDFQMVTSKISMKISFEKSLPNLKKITEKNREVAKMLQMTNFLLD